MERRFCALVGRENMLDVERPADLIARFAAWAVHLFTAAGVILAMLATMAVMDHRWTAAMLWLFAALIVDAVDGTLARAARVKQLVPRIEGDSLDLVIDYLTYVFIPVLFILEAELLPGRAALPLCAAVLVSSLYVFARRDMKTEDGYFRGFPALWNLVALYLHATQLDRTAAATIVALLVILTFAPIHVVHPLRVRDYGAAPAMLGVGWAGFTLALLFPGWAPATDWLLLFLSVATAVILVALGLLRTFRGLSLRSG